MPNCVSTSGSRNPKSSFWFSSLRFLRLFPRIESIHDVVFRPDRAARVLFHLLYCSFILSVSKEAG